MLHVEEFLATGPCILEMLEWAAEYDRHSDWDLMADGYTRDELAEWLRAAYAEEIATDETRSMGPRA